MSRPRIFARLAGLARASGRVLVAPVLAALALLAACGGPAKPPATPRLSGAAAGWNLVVVSVDTVRADRLGVYGYDRRPTSPRIDALFAEGVGFSRAIAPRGLTWPSLASVLTGLYPSGHGVIYNGYEFADETPTLPKLLAAAGYRTGAFLNNMMRANHQGWEVLNSAGGAERKLTRRALEWVAELDPERPFFLWTHYFGAHSPYAAGKAWAGAVLDPTYAGPVIPGKKALNEIMLQGIPLGERDLAYLDGLYDGAVTGTDAVVGELLDGLAAAGRRERTLVVFLADHGEELYDHNAYLYHACSVYESVLRVPLAFVAPGLVPAGEIVAPPVELIDVAPTVLDLLGIEPPAELHGVSLVPYLEQPRRAGAKPAFSEYSDTRIHTALAGGWKLIVNPDGYEPECFEGAPRDLYPIAGVELYDLESDPEETVNVAGEHPERVAALAELIDRRFASLADRRRTQELPEELKEELRALGYVAK